MITPKDIDNLAELSRLELSSEEKAGFEKDLNSILDYVAVISSIGDISDSGELLTDNVNTMRDDEVTTETTEYTRALVDCAPEHREDYIKVKKILG